jgi:methionyl-tRNA formyltransferase
MMRIVFFGTPEFAVPALRRLVADDQFSVQLVVTRPDRPTGRGGRVERSAVGRAAAELDVPLYQPMTLRDPVARHRLVEIGADFFVVAAYGLIFGAKTLALPRLGCVNVHASLLPRYRGASPIPAVILAGDAETGISLMQMDTGLDTGPIIASRVESIRPDDTTESLTTRLAAVSAQLVAETLPRIMRHELSPVAQATVGASVTRPLTKADGWLDWHEPAIALERRVRAMWPWPRGWTTINDELVQVHRASVGPSTSGHPPGSWWIERQMLYVACGEQSLVLELVQPAGGRPMSGAAMVAGWRQLCGRFGEHGGPGVVTPISAPAATPVVDTK